MRRDIINAHALQKKVDELLEGGPPALRGKPALRGWLRRALESHSSVRKARRRQSDPAWAQTKFDNGCMLHRFHPKDLNAWEVEGLLDKLKEVTDIASKGGGHSGMANNFLLGLSHRPLDLDEAEREASHLIERVERSALLARRNEKRRKPTNVVVGKLTGTLCESINDIKCLGREAKNCLDELDDYWKRFAANEIDIWSLREGDRLVAIFEVRRPQRLVVEAYGPSNAAIRLQDVHQVARFCAEANLHIGPRCGGVLPDYATSPLVAPTPVEIGKRIAFYAEWPTAVRIDLSDKTSKRFAMIGGTTDTLSLSFDPDQLCGAGAFGRNDPRQVISAFGRKKVRKIVRAIALAQAEPTLVQHRLLALAA